MLTRREFLERLGLASVGAAIASVVTVENKPVKEPEIKADIVQEFEHIQSEWDSPYFHDGGIFIRQELEDSRSKYGSPYFAAGGSLIRNNPPEGKHTSWLDNNSRSLVKGGT